jgi:hypothetical protein
MIGYFKAEIYKSGINWCVDIPVKITDKMFPDKGYIKVKGQINSFDFTKNLVPVKNGPYRLFVNLTMMKGAKTSVGEIAEFNIEQDFAKANIDYPVPGLLFEQLGKKKLTDDFDRLTNSRRKEILKYLSYIKTEKTLKKNIDKLIKQLEDKHKNIRIP